MWFTFQVGIYCFVLLNFQLCVKSCYRIFKLQRIELFCPMGTVSRCHLKKPMFPSIVILSVQLHILRLGYEREILRQFKDSSHHPIHRTIIRGENS